MEQIKNDQLTVEISAHGAELKSIKDANGNEYLWDGDKEFWGGQSPLLFPIVGGLWKNTYRIGDKEYTLSRHGFGKLVDFKLVGKPATALPSPSSTTRRPSRTILSTSTSPFPIALPATNSTLSGTLRIPTTR